jgi:hypothetical protein
LADYGSGVVMGVPHHDERDGRLAALNGIKGTQVLISTENEGTGVCV